MILAGQEKITIPINPPGIEHRIDYSYNADLSLRQGVPMFNQNPAPGCPCGSKNPYPQCCGLYIGGIHTPPTAEALMRSRYTAYTQANIPYIQATMRERAAAGYNPVEAARWASSAQWEKLRVISAFAHNTDPDRYYVKFVALYSVQGQPQEINETSEFRRIEGRWYYVDGIR